MTFTFVFILLAVSYAHAKCVMESAKVIEVGTWVFLRPWVGVVDEALISNCALKTIEMQT